MVSALVSGWFRLGCRSPKVHGKANPGAVAKNGSAYGAPVGAADAGTIYLLLEKTSNSDCLG
jgi:hypothetical protein